MSDAGANPTVICVANLKGGVGKTTTAVHLAAGLAREDRETLLVDLDAQGSATAHLMDPGDVSHGVGDVLAGRLPLEEAARPTGTDKLAILPWSGEPESQERLGEDPAALSRALTRAAMPGVRYVVVDTPPHLGSPTVTALVAAHGILVPVNCEYLPILGLKQFNEALARIRNRHRVPARILGYVLTQVDRRERITWEVEDILRRTFGSLVLRTTIRIDTKLKTCPSHRTTVYDFEGDEGRARNDYTELVRELIARLESDDDLPGR
jgi:chromosome partitioning protein